MDATGDLARYSEPGAGLKLRSLYRNQYENRTQKEPRGGCTCQQLEGSRVKLVDRSIDVYGCPALLTGQAGWFCVVRHNVIRGGPSCCYEGEVLRRCRRWMTMRRFVVGDHLQAGGAPPAAAKACWLAPTRPSHCQLSRRAN